MPKLTVLFAGTTLIASAVAFHFWQQLRTEHALVAQQGQGAQVVQSGPQPTGQSNPAATTQTDLPGVAADASVSEAIAASATSPSRAAANAPAKAATSEYTTTSLKLNQLQELYPGVAKALAMTPAEAEAYYDLLQKQGKDPRTARSMMENGIVDEQVLKRARAESEIRQKEEFAAMFGPAKARQLEEYMPTVEARRRVNELTMMLASSSPLTEKQSVALVNNIFGEQSRRAQDESLRTPPANDPRAQLEFEELNLQRRIESNRRTVDAARSFLNPEQLTLMQDAQARGNDRIRVSLQSRRERLESGTTEVRP